MIKLKHNLFELAVMQLNKEKVEYNINDILDRAVKIRKFLDKKEKLAKQILRPIKSELRKQYYLKTGR